MNTIDRVQSWYFSQCNGDWEHGNGIRIETLDNPGWLVDINLADTALEGKLFDRVQMDRTELDWLWAWKDENKFSVRCGPKNLEEALLLFLNWAEK